MIRPVSHFSFADADPDRNEALHLRYSNSVLHLVPLSSGRLAVLGVSRMPEFIVDTWDEACEAHARIDFTNYRQERIEAARAPIQLDLDLSTLTL